MDTCCQVFASNQLPLRSFRDTSWACAFLGNVVPSQVTVQQVMRQLSCMNFNSTALSASRRRGSRQRPRVEEGAVVGAWLALKRNAECS